MKNILIVLFAMTTAACAIETDDTSQGVSSNPFRWMEGAWLCSTGYHAISPIVGRNGAGTYTVTEDAHGIVHGHYHELSADDLHALVDFDDTWHVGSTPDANGAVAVTYSMVTSDGFSASATGTVRGPVGTAVAGTDSFEGFITFPDGTQRNWHASSIETLNTGPKFTANYSFGTLNTKLLYLTMGCTPIVEMEPPISQVAVTKSSIAALLNPPRPQPSFGYCTWGGRGGNKIPCYPTEPDYCDSMCRNEDGFDGGYCPDYTLSEYDNCRDLCFTEWGIGHCTNFCLPSWTQNCISGQRP